MSDSSSNHRNPSKRTFVPIYPIPTTMKDPRKRRLERSRSIMFSLKTPPPLPPTVMEPQNKKRKTLRRRWDMLPILALDLPQQTAHCIHCNTDITGTYHYIDNHRHGCKKTKSNISIPLPPPPEEAEAEETEEEKENLDAFSSPPSSSDDEDDEDDSSSSSSSSSSCEEEEKDLGYQDSLAPLITYFEKKYSKTLAQQVLKVKNETVSFSQHVDLLDLVEMRKAAKKLNRITNQFEKITTKTMNGIETMTNMTEDDLLNMCADNLLLGKKQQKKVPIVAVKKKKQKKQNLQKKKRAYNNMMIADRTQGGPKVAKYTAEHLDYMRLHQYENILPLLIGVKAEELYGIWNMYAEMAKEIGTTSIPRTPSGIESYLRKHKLRLQDMLDPWLVERMIKLGVMPWPTIRHTVIRRRMVRKLLKAKEKSKKKLPFKIIGQTWSKEEVAALTDAAKDVPTTLGRTDYFKIVFNNFGLEHKRKIRAVRKKARSMGFRPDSETKKSK